MKLKFFFLLLLSLYIVNCAFYIEAQATIRYVSKTGTSIPPYTNWQTAADSIQKCINICVDGDTIYVANGVYKENLVINTQIFLSGLSKDSTIIDGRGMGQFTIWLNEVATIENFNIYGKGLNTIQTAAITALKYLELKFCRISEASDGVDLINTADVHNNIVTNCLAGLGLAPIYDTCKLYITDNLFTLYNINERAIASSIYGIYTISNNILTFNGANNQGTKGISIGAPRKVYIYNNLISGFTDNIFFDTVLDTAFIINNLLCYQNSGSGLPASIYSRGQKIITDNVILLKNKRGINGDDLVRSDYNLFWENETNYIGVTPGDSDIVADPMFIKDTIPRIASAYDYHLQKYSPAIDKGDPSILDVDGSRSDIGLFGGPLGESYTYQDIEPKPPRNLTASMDSGLVHLKWNKNTEADLFRYRVYRDTVPDFIYDTTKIIAVLSDTTFYDDPPQKFISGNYYYKITAIDSAFHQSPASEEAHINITGIPEAPPIVVEHYNLLQNYPNPFNPGTTIPYRLKSPGYVKVMVYNLLGEQVKVLVNKYQSAGYYEVLFHPTATERQSAEGKIEFETGYGDIVSGIYLYRIEVIGEGNIPVFTDMKKMMMVK